jgi:CBS domain containing-hemolysin-like protein
MTPRTDIDYYDLNDPPETNRRKMIEAAHRGRWYVAED